MRAVTLALAGIPVVFGGLGVALVAGGFDPFDTFAPTIDQAPLSPPTASDPTSQVSDSGTAIDGRRPHLYVVDGHAPLELPASLPAILSLLPPSATELAPLPPSAATGPAPAHGDTHGGAHSDGENHAGQHGSGERSGDGPAAAPDSAAPRVLPPAEPGAAPIPGARSLPLPWPDESEAQPSASEPLPSRVSSAPRPAPRPDPDALAMLAGAPTDQVRTPSEGDPALSPTTAPPTTGQDESSDGATDGGQPDRTLTVTRVPEDSADTDPVAPPGTDPRPGPRSAPDTAPDTAPDPR